MSLGEEEKETKLRRWLHGQTPSSDGCGAALGGGWSWSLVDLVLGGLSGARLRMSRRWPLHRHQAGLAGAGGSSAPDAQHFVEVGCGKVWGVASTGWSAKHSPGRAV